MVHKKLTLRLTLYELSTLLRDICLVIAGAIIGFAIAEGPKSPTFKGDFYSVWPFLIFAFVFGVIRHAFEQPASSDAS